jgi:RNA polymerase sigma-70 factor (ECF subfamily)
MPVQPFDASMAFPAPAAASDAVLIAAWQAGDEGAAIELVRRHTRALARYLAAPGGEADLDDVVQDSFGGRSAGSERFRGQCQFRTWLLTIGANTLKDLGRQAMRRPVVPLDDDVAAARGDPHDETVARETEARLAAGLRILSPLQREVFLLRAQQGLEYGEIAAALDTTEGAARVHHHAVKRLRNGSQTKKTSPAITRSVTALQALAARLGARAARMDVDAWGAPSRAHGAGLCLTTRVRAGPMWLRVAAALVLAGAGSWHAGWSHRPIRASAADG